MVYGQWGFSGIGGGVFFVNLVIGVELIKDGSERLIRNWKVIWSVVFFIEWEVSFYRLQNGLFEFMILFYIFKIVQFVFNLFYYQYIVKFVL